LRPAPDFLALALAAVAVLPLALGAQDHSSSRAPMSKGTTEALVGRFEAAEHWVQKVVVLLSLTNIGTRLVTR
jgi:hypothetical protein